MALPPLIEIEPVAQPVTAHLSMPGSKSVTNRAMILAALGQGQTLLRGALWSEDTQVMAEALRKLGLMVEITPDEGDEGNRCIAIEGRNGSLTSGGTLDSPLELFVGNAGTAARFLTALVCLGNGVYRLAGVPRMHERPQGALFDALRQLGYRVDTPNHRLPALVHGSGPRSAQCRVSVEDSSQFASALYLTAAKADWNIEVTGHNAEELPYVSMTRELVAQFPAEGGVFDIEADASGGSYFRAADWLLRQNGMGQVTLANWPETTWQIDARFPRYLPLPPVISRSRDLGDSIMTAIVLAPFGDHAVEFRDLGRLRLQECDRVEALVTELTRCGAQVRVSGDTLRMNPSRLHGGDIRTYDDHRVAMCFATMGLRVAGIRLHNPDCVKKTFPNFFQKLAAAPPRGLGVAIRDATTGRRLAEQELLAA